MAGSRPRRAAAARRLRGFVVRATFSSGFWTPASRNAEVKSIGWTSIARIVGGVSGMGASPCPVCSRDDRLLTGNASRLWSRARFARGGWRVVCAQTLDDQEPERRGLQQTGGASDLVRWLHLSLLGSRLAHDDAAHWLTYQSKIDWRLSRN